MGHFVLFCTLKCGGGGMPVIAMMLLVIIMPMVMKRTAIFVSGCGNDDDPEAFIGFIWAMVFAAVSSTCIANGIYFLNFRSDISISILEKNLEYSVFLFAIVIVYLAIALTVYFTQLGKSG